MTGKYLKIITLLGVVVLVMIQCLWLQNTYQLIEIQLQQTSNRLFPKATVEEGIQRLNQLTNAEGTDKTLGLSTSMNQQEALEKENLFDHVTIFLNHYADSAYQSSISLALLDSIFTDLLAQEGYQAELVCQLVDSSGNILETEANKLLKSSFKTVETTRIYLDREQTRAVQAIIVNPYWIAFQQMGYLLLATILLILFVVGCILYQVKIIIKQNKIARLRQDFTYAMIHDMKTPISTIAMAGHTLESGLLDHKPALRKQYFTILHEESEHLLNLSEKILTIAKLEQSRLKLIKSEVDLPKLFEELVHKYQIKAEKPVTFRVSSSLTHPLMADEEYLKEAICNLIDNSLKYSGETVEIRLSAKEQEEYVQIKIWDNGWGIPLKQQKHIFEKFQRGGLEYQKEKRVSGFGLGLNYVYKVITAMGGTVVVNSIEGEYSEFLLTLPIASLKK